MCIVDYLFPKRCIGCGTWGRYLCASCLSTVSLSVHRCIYCHKPSYLGITHHACKTQFGLDGVYSFYSYRGVIQKAIKSVKYRFSYHVISSIVESIPQSKVLAYKNRIGSKAWVMVPIPLHKKRLRWRGFNQAEYVARELENIFHIPVRGHVLQRVKETPPQAEIHNRLERIENINNVFIVPERYQAQLRGKAIILIDDVCTTGATLQAACKVLKIAGAIQVWGVAIAQ